MFLLECVSIQKAKAGPRVRPDSLKLCNLERPEVPPLGQMKEMDKNVIEICS